jgi:hypothetical protein
LINTLATISGFDDKLATNVTRASSKLLPSEWLCSIHDKTLLKAVSDKGFDVLNNISDNPDYEMQDMNISAETAIKRIEEICEFFKE